MKVNGNPKTHALDDLIGQPCSFCKEPIEWKGDMHLVGSVKTMEFETYHAKCVFKHFAKDHV